MEPHEEISARDPAAARRAAARQPTQSVAVPGLQLLVGPLDDVVDRLVQQLKQGPNRLQFRKDLFAQGYLTPVVATNCVGFFRV